MTTSAQVRARVWADLVREIVEEPDLDDRCRTICRHVVTGFGFSRALLATVDGKRNRLVARAAYDPTMSLPVYRVLSALYTASTEPNEEGKWSVVAWCVKEKEQIHVPDAKNYGFRPDQTFQRHRFVRAIGTREYLVTPILYRGRALGLLGVDKKGVDESITAEDRELAWALAGLAGLALGDLAYQPVVPRAGPADATERRSDVDGRSQKWLMQDLLDGLHEGLVVVGAEGNVRYLNRAAANLLGVVPWETIGRSWSEVIPVREREQFGRLVWDSRDGHGGRSYRWKLEKAGGREVDVEIQLLPFSSDRMPGGRAILISDVRHHAAIERLRDEFTSMLVHDLKAPLQSIVGFAELLRLGRLGELNEDQVEFIRRVEESGEAMMRLIEDILMVARIESGRGLMQKSRVSPRPLVDKVVEHLQGKALPLGVRLVNEVPTDFPDLFGDPTRLTETFQNLIDNAINACGPDSTVRVTARRLDGPEPQAGFAVIDDGPGLDEEAAGHLFDKFWVGQDVPGEHPRPRGLGLVIARLVVESHRGEIYADSRPDGGTTIRFTLPLFREREP